MRIADNWKDYELIDCSDGEKLERWGDVILIRPDPQIIWHTKRTHPLWRKAHARYIRSNKGGGEWQIFRKIPKQWSVNYNDLKFNVKTMGFKHTGIFPEQATNWDFARNKIKNENRELNILNLFGYTGCATLSCMKEGARVCHVDASKGMVLWAKENAVASGIADKPVRWLVDDCIKFVEREIRRGHHYDGIIMDPPSYGRGPNGEVWKLEDNLYSLIELCEKVLSDDPVFFILNSYSTGLSAGVMEYMLGAILKPKFGGKVSSDVKKGEFLCVLGHNGSGKSTLAKHFNAILLPCGGKVYVDKMDTADEDKCFDIRSNVGLVLQNPDNQLVASVVEEDVAFGPENLGVPPKEIRERVDNALKAVDMYEYRTHSPDKLSGGQKQRVAIAGIIAMEPSCIVLDEPTAMLDPRGRQEVMDTITKLNRERGITIVLITHYMDEAVKADRVIVMDDGKILTEGTPKEVFSQVDLIKEHSLDVPQATEICYELQKAGVNIKELPLDEESCVDVLMEVLK